MSRDRGAPGWDSTGVYDYSRLDHLNQWADDNMPLDLTGQRVEQEVDDE